MEDDVKNLFQKIGKPVTGYQEINRTVVTEQARKRWPLLRDVNIHSLPGQAESAADPVAELALAEPEVTGNHSSHRVGLKNLFKPQHEEAAAPNPVNGGFFEKLHAKAEVAAEPGLAANSIFGLRNKSQAIEATAPVQTKPEIKNSPVAEAVVAAATVQTQSATVQPGVKPVLNLFAAKTQAAPAGEAAAKPAQAVQSVLDRLAGKAEQPKVQQVSKSFFNKIFKS